MATDTGVDTEGRRIAAPDKRETAAEAALLGLSVTGYTTLQKRSRRRSAGAMATVTATTGRTNYSTDIQSRNHRLSADEPPESGGQDAGPRPSELLIAALASCTSITLRMYADRKAWAIEAIHVSVTASRAPDKTLSVERVLSFEGVLTDEQKNRLAEIAERTPVTLALKAGVAIHTRLG
jgi:putative redox protein